MKTKRYSSFILHPSAMCLPLLALLALAPRAPAQSPWGNAQRFPGGGGLGGGTYVWVNPGVVLSNRSFTIEFWAKQETYISDTGTVISQGALAMNQCLRIQLGATARFSFWGNDLAAAATVDGFWHHWAFAYDATSHARKIFRDGVLIAQDTATGNYQGSGALYLGKFLYDAADLFALENYYSGDLDDVRVWGVARSAADISAQLTHPLTGAEPDLLAYWKLDESTGCNTFDATGNGFDGLLVNLLPATQSTVPYSPVGWGKALSFDGVNDSVRAGAVPLANSSFTIEAWARRDSAVGMDFILGQGGGGTDRSLHFGFHAGSAFVLGFYNDDLFTTDVYTDLEWHHWAGTYNAATKARCLYRDGVLVASNTASANYQGSGPITIGTVPWGAGGDFDGEVDDVRIWNIARSQPDIAAQMSYPLTGNEPNLLAYWRFDEGGTGTNTADATPNRFDGMLVNGPSWTNSTLPQYPVSWGTALSFNGSSQYVVMPTNTWFGDQFTIEAWVYVRSHHSYSRVLDFGNGAPLDNVILCTSGWNLGTPTLQVNRGSSGADLTSPQTIPTNQWVHLAATFKTNTGVLYVNGYPMATNAAMPAPNPVNRTNNYVARSNWPTDPSVNAIIDDVRIWNVARTAGQIQEARSHPLRGTEANLVAYYRFDEGGAGVWAVDASPNRRHGKLVNRPVRVPSFWSPQIALNGPNLLTNECHSGFTDPACVKAPIVAIEAGKSYHDHGMALRADGTIVAWGNDWCDPNASPDNATNVVAIAAGYDFSVELKADGTVVAWGDNNRGQTNTPASATNVVAIAAGVYHSLALRADGKVVAWGYNEYHQTNTPANATNVVAIAAGDFHSLALRADGKVVAWGRNSDGQTNVPASLSNVVAIAAAGDESAALRANGTAVGWGRDDWGQASSVTNLTGIVALAHTGYGAIGLRPDGTVVGSIAPILPATISNVVAISANYSWLALRADGTVLNYSVVAPFMSDLTNTAYQVNLPLAANAPNTNSVGTYLLTYRTTNSLGAVAAASRTVVVADRQPPGLTLNGTNPMLVNFGTMFVDPGASASDVCAGDLTGRVISNITVNTSLRGAYTNTFTVTDDSGNCATNRRTVFVGLLAATTLPPTNLVNDTATLLGTVNPNGAPTSAWFEWGAASAGGYANRTAVTNVGSGSSDVIITALISNIAPGLSYRYRLVASNSTWLVSGGEQAVWRPVINLQGPSFLTIPQGTPYSDPAIPFGTPLGIAAGAGHGLAIAVDGTVAGWGDNYCGQISAPTGLAGVIAVAAGSSMSSSHSMALKADGTVACWGGVTNTPPNLTGVKAIAAGGEHCLALRTNGTVVGWGNNYFGETDVPANLTNVVAVAAGTLHSLALLSDGRVMGWGIDNCGESTGATNPLPHVQGYPPTTPYLATGIVAVAGQTLSNVVAIAAGSGFSLAAKADGTVVSWGGTMPGTISIPPSATNVVAMAAAGDSTCLALRADGTIASWGCEGYYGATAPDLTNVVAIAAGNCHKLALLADGTIVEWGWGWGVPAYVYTLNMPLGVIGSVNTNVLGTYIINYSTTNALGATATASRTVVVATPPIVTTEPVAGVGPTWVTLQGTVNPRASQTLGWFKYGVGANYASETQKVPLGNATNAQLLAIQLTNVLSWMTYNYRAVAANALGQVEGLQGSFTLPGPSVITPSLSGLSDVTLPQGGSTSVWFTVSPSVLEVRVAGNNPVLLPSAGVSVGGAGGSRTLSIVPAANQSGSGQVTVAATDGSRSVSRTINVTVIPSAGSGGAGLLYLADAQIVSTQAWRFHLVDVGTGSTNYEVQYRSGLAPTNAWVAATNVTALGGGVFEVALGPPPPPLGFYRAKGFRLLMGGFGSDAVTAVEGGGPSGPVLVFNGIYTGWVTNTWTDEEGASWNSAVWVNGTTAVAPVPASCLTDNAGLGRLSYLTLQLQGSASFVLGGTTRSTVTVEENEANWQGAAQTPVGLMAFGLSLTQTNGSLRGQIQSDGFGFFPTNILVQVNLTDNAFTAVATNIPLAALAAYPPLGFTNYLDLHLDATNGPGVTNVGPAQIQGTATLVSKMPGRSYADTAIYGSFQLLKVPTAPSTNEVPLYPAP